MKQNVPARRLSRGRWLVIGAVLLAVLVLAPSIFAGGMGRLLGDVWVTVMGAVVRLLGG